jgi:hypothetical protein
MPNFLGFASICKLIGINSNMLLIGHGIPQNL